MIYTREIPENNEYDVIVAGGGPAGCAAATASARLGAKTLLIEASGCLGGMATIGLVPAWTPYSDGEKIIYNGISEEVFRKASKAIPFADVDKNSDWVSIDAEALKLVYDKLVVGSGANVLFNTSVCDVISEGNRVSKVIVSNKAGLCAYGAKAFVDCTGDADIAYSVGVPTLTGDDGEVQPSTLCFTLTGVNEDKYDELGNMYASSSTTKIFEMIADEDLPLIKDTHICQSHINYGVVGFNAGHLFNVDSTNPESVSHAIIEGRELAHEFDMGLKKYCPEVYGNAHLTATAPSVGVRESRRIVGEYVLTVDDYVACRTFYDDIGRNCYFVDIHNPLSTGEKLKTPDAVQKSEDKRLHLERGQSHGIPYRCLVPKGVDNLLVAGRTISTDRSVQGSTRVMPVCLVTGEAAGKAAAIIAKNDCKANQVFDKFPNEMK